MNRLVRPRWYPITIHSSSNHAVEPPRTGHETQREFWPSDAAATGVIADQRLRAVPTAGPPETRQSQTERCRCRQLRGAAACRAVQIAPLSESHLRSHSETRQLPALPQPAVAASSLRSECRLSYSLPNLMTSRNSSDRWQQCSMPGDVYASSVNARRDASYHWNSTRCLQVTLPVRRCIRRIDLR